MNEAKWTLRTQDETFGPVTGTQLVEWARLGRIQPGQEVSEDGGVIWRRVEDMPFLDMRFSIDLGDGNPRGPFNQKAAEALLASGRLPATAKIIEVREPFGEETEARVAAEAKTEVRPESEVKVVEKIVEKRVEVPIEKIVEKVVEKRVEVPVEKIVEKVVEKVVVDETRVKELEILLASHEAKAVEMASREAKLVEQVKSLEDELRRLPQAASEIADIQAAMYSVMTKEADELRDLLEVEKREAEEFRVRQQSRADRLLERRREILKRAGANIEDMTRRALVERPEDPRTAQLRQELEELRRTSERTNQQYESKIRDLEESLRVKEAELKRSSAQSRDLTEWQREAQELRERLQLREKELLNARQDNESLRKNQAMSQQAMITRLADLESPILAPANGSSVNQSREAHMVKLPKWMRIGK